MLIVEGPDGSGKTTLLSQLQNMLGWQRAARAVGSDMRPLLNVGEYIDQMMSISRQDLLLDRFAIISGSIYGPLVAMGSPNEEFQDSLWLMERLQRFALNRQYDRIRVVYCLPPFTTVEANLHQDRAQPQHVLDRISTLYWAYWMRAHEDKARYPDSTYIYDYTTDIVHSVANFARRNRSA